MRTLVLVLIALFAASACTSIEGTRDLSKTTSGHRVSSITSLAILPIPPSSAADALSDRLGQGLEAAFRRSFPTATVRGPSEVGSDLARQGLLEVLANWSSVYSQTSIVDPHPLKRLSDGLDVRYLLVISDVHLAREKIRATDSGRVGFVSDANNVWRTKLRVTADLIDVQSRARIWRGVGEAENINSPRRDLDLGLVIFQAKNPEIEAFLDEMISVLSGGIAQQLGGAHSAP